LDRVNDIRWFAPNAYTALLVPELRLRGLSIALEGTEPARLVVSMSGTTAEAAWRFGRRYSCPLVLYLWDLPPQATESGSYDSVWWLGGFFVRWPKLTGGFGRRRGHYSRLRYIAARGREVWVPSQMTGELVRKRFGVASVRVPYCYDSHRFHPTPVAPDHPPSLLTVSRLKPHKNQAATLRAAARFCPPVQVRLIGRGPDRDSLEQLARSLGVRCQIDSDASDAAVAEAYRRATVVVCPSKFEGFGLTPVEAIASGARVVASDIPPHREFLGNAARFFSPDDDAALHDSIAAAIESTAPDPAQVRDLTIAAAADRFADRLRPLVAQVGA
jgi:glycosyltransferase involved in cell wall biosynthesis